MATLETSVSISKSVEQVFEYITNLDNQKKLSKYITGLEVDGPVKLGTKYKIETTSTPVPAVLLERQGVVVLRPAPDALVAVECGARAAGHGHPDALHLTLARGGLLLGDFGTGSYVSPSLHWYRSTLAHNAPGLAGRGQAPVAGVCDGVGSADGWSWCRVYADGLLGPGTWARRTVVAGPAWMLDAVSVNVPPDVVVDLPVHPLAGLAASGEPGSPDIADSTTDAGHETGYAHVTGVARSNGDKALRPKACWPY